MSSDISIKVVHPDGYETYVEVGNYTYNTNPMLKLAVGLSMGGFNKMSCEDAAPLLEHAVHLMELYPEKYIALNPDNGWGDYTGFLAFIKKWESLVKLHPTGVIVSD